MNQTSEVPVFLHYELNLHKEAQVGHLEFEETNPTISGDVQTAPTSSERTRCMNPCSPVKSEAT